jgi:hypothetical protein
VHRSGARRSAHPTSPGRTTRSARWWSAADFSTEPTVPRSHRLRGARLVDVAHASRLRPISIVVFARAVTWSSGARYALHARVWRALAAALCRENARHRARTGSAPVSAKAICLPGFRPEHATPRALADAQLRGSSCSVCESCRAYWSDTRSPGSAAVAGELLGERTSRVAVLRCFRSQTGGCG